MDVQGDLQTYGAPDETLPGACIKGAQRLLKLVFDSGLEDRTTDDMDAEPAP